MQLWLLHLSVKVMAFCHSNLSFEILLCRGFLTEVECEHGTRLRDVDQPGVLLPQDAVVPQTGHPDRHQTQSCRETTNQSALTDICVKYLNTRVVLCHLVCVE